MAFIVLGPRACYDEGKRVAETLSYAYAKQEKVKVRVARIFNTYGPRMHMNDGRVVSNFILQALQNESITVIRFLNLKQVLSKLKCNLEFTQIYGHGRQTRSFQYVSDLVDGLTALMNSNYSQPVNLGNPVEHTIDGKNIIICIELCTFFTHFLYILSFCICRVCSDHHVYCQRSAKYSSVLGCGRR